MRDAEREKVTESSAYVRISMHILLWTYVCLRACTCNGVDVKINVTLVSVHERY